MSNTNFRETKQNKRDFMLAWNHRSCKLWIERCISKISTIVTAKLVAYAYHNGTEMARPDARNKHMYKQKMIRRGEDW